MTYVVSDIHGCYQEFLELLELIEFSEQDDLYILGDMVDRGPDPIPLLQDLLLRPNVYPLFGNHDYVALNILRKLNVEITEENFESHLTEDDFMDYMYWVEDGGNTTVNQFARLDWEKREAVLEYLEECALFEELEIEGRKYILVHADMPQSGAGLEGSGRDASTDAGDLPVRGTSSAGSSQGYGLADLIFHRADYKRRYFQKENTFLVTGHTPTALIRADEKPLVYEAYGHIAIDCGCVFGGNLAAYRLDDHKAFYVAKAQDV